MVGDPERLGGGDVPRGPHRDPVYGEQLRGVTHHGEGVHEGRDEDQGGRLPGRSVAILHGTTQLESPFHLHLSGPSLISYDIKSHRDPVYADNVCTRDIVICFWRGLPLKCEQQPF